MPGPFLSLEMLPARHGDCLWLEYGDDGATHRVLVDGGPVETYEHIMTRLGQVPGGERAFELVVLTHVDSDHVEGLVRLFADKPLAFNVDRVWFNGWRQMKKSHGLLGADQGEFLSALLVERVPTKWDQDGPPLAVLHAGQLPRQNLPGGLQITLLSPTPKKLQVMTKEWERFVKGKHLKPGDLAGAWRKLSETKKFLPKRGLLGAAPSLDSLLKQESGVDSSKANGSSLAFLAEYAGKSVLLLGDAHKDVLASAIRRLCKERGVKKLAVGAVKVSHHGSKNNTNDALVDLIDSPRWLISTNGDKFKHPDKSCIARIIKRGKPRELWFNYSSKFTKPWLSKAAADKFGYTPKVRPAQDVSIRIDL